MSTEQSIDELYHWQLEAACIGYPTSLFYPEKWADGIQHQYYELRQLCARCPVLTECGEYAIHHERFGYWAGLTEKQRMVERRRRGMQIDRRVRSDAGFERGEKDARRAVNARWHV